MPVQWTHRGRKRAREAREELEIPPGPIGDLLALVEERTAARVLVLELPDGIAGAYLLAGRPLLVVDAADALVRKRFTLAHELGHFRMGHGTVVDAAVEMYGKTLRPNEVEANAFAAELLAPRSELARVPALRGGVRLTLQDLCELACGYGVSAQAMRFQLEAAGVLDDAQHIDRLDQEIAKDLHTELCERLGLGPPPDGLAEEEPPRVPPELRDSALGDLLGGVCDAAGYARRVGAEPAAVERMLGRFGLDRVLPAAL